MTEFAYMQNFVSLRGRGQSKDVVPRQFGTTSIRPEIDSLLLLSKHPTHLIIIYTNSVTMVLAYITQLGAITRQNFYTFPVLLIINSTITKQRTAHRTPNFFLLDF